MTELAPLFEQYKAQAEKLRQERDDAMYMLAEALDILTGATLFNFLSSEQDLKLRQIRSYLNEAIVRKKNGT